MTDSGARWEQGLTGAAYGIAATTASPLRVLAGPGTGKTFALMRRVSRLLEEGADPERLFVCTFTRTAARDLANEIGRLGVPGADLVRTGTVHAFCFGLLAESAVLLITGRVPRPLLAYEERFLLEDLRISGGENLHQLRTRLNAFGAAWARLQTDEPGWPPDPTDRSFATRLRNWLVFHQAMLVGELVPEALRFLRDNPESAVRGDFSHVLVDEYQDLNRAEQVLLDVVAGAGALTVIGDEDQSIYSFKFAHPEGIADFDQTHPATHDESLVECRRCPRLVVSMANHLIGENSTRAARVLASRPSNPVGEVLVVQWPSMESEAHGVAAIVNQRIAASQVSAGQILVLAPRRQIGYAIRDALVALAVPAHSFFHEESLDGNPTEPEGWAAQESFALLTLLARPLDRVALRCWCGFGSQSLHSPAWRRLWAHCDSSGTAPKAVLEALGNKSLVLSYTGAIAERYRLLQVRLSALAGLRGTTLVDTLFPSAAGWAAPLRAVAESLPGDGDAAALLELVQRRVTQPELPTDVDYVRVMSLHKSKGLTASLVVVAGCIEGLIPTLPEDVPGAVRQAALEEQRRLFYVAITRTTQTLLVSSVARVPRAFAHKMRVPVHGGSREVANTITSRFVEELGPDRPPVVAGASVA